MRPGETRPRSSLLMDEGKAEVRDRWKERQGKSSRKGGAAVPSQAGNRCWPWVRQNGHQAAMVLMNERTTKERSSGSPCVCRQASSREEKEMSVVATDD